MGVNDNALPLQNRFAKDELFELQIEQNAHDEKYHREIARLALHHRLNHMALHFAKYTGKIASPESDLMVCRTFVDTLIIALSTANTLNTTVGDLFDGLEGVTLREFSQNVEKAMTLKHRGRLELTNLMAIPTGRIAAACEKIDHLEEIAFRSEIKAGLADLLRLSLAFLVGKDLDPASEIRRRLQEVKARSIFHGGP